MAVIIRPLRPDDAQDLGAVHVRAWQRAYRGVMPDEYLDNLTAAERGARWAEGLSHPPRPRGARLGAEVDGRLLGFILIGPADGDATSETGEVYALNVDPDAWGTGVARSLLDAGVAHLRETGFTDAVLWVAPRNERARHFYEKADWDHDGGDRRQEILGVEVEETRYRRPLRTPEAQGR